MKGSIKKYIATNGKVTWRAIVDLPRHPETGKRRQRRITATTERKAEAEVAKLISEIATGAYSEADASKMTVGQYMRERWLPSIEHSMKPASLSAYENVINRHVEPALGKLMLSKLGPMQLQRFYTEKLAAGLSSTTVALMHRVLHRALGQAVLWRLLLRNPAEAVEVPRNEHKEFATWTPEEAATFLAATAGDEYAALWRLALFTGMRLGEILGLKWANVDLGLGLVSVTQTLMRGRTGGLVEGSPKTAASRRQISVPASVVESLRAHRLRQVEARLELGAYDDQGFVFANPFGKPLHSSTINARFIKLIGVSGVPRIRFHDLRHTCATLMLRGGEHPKIVQERLGHSNISMTLNRYSHVTPDMQKGAADRLDRLIEGA